MNKKTFLVLSLSVAMLPLFCGDIREFQILEQIKKRGSYSTDDAFKTLLPEYYNKDVFSINQANLFIEYKNGYKAAVESHFGISDYNTDWKNRKYFFGYVSWENPQAIMLLAGSMMLRGWSKDKLLDVLYSSDHDGLSLILIEDMLSLCKEGRNGELDSVIEEINGKIAKKLPSDIQDSEAFFTKLKAFSDDYIALRYGGKQALGNK
jgi:hypothetical protein